MGLWSGLAANRVDRVTPHSRASCKYRCTCSSSRSDDSNFASISAFHDSLSAKTTIRPSRRSLVSSGTVTTTSVSVSINDRLPKRTPTDDRSSCANPGTAESVARNTDTTHCSRRPSAMTGINLAAPPDSRNFGNDVVNAPFAPSLNSTVYHSTRGNDNPRGR